MNEPVTLGKVALVRTKAPAFLQLEFLLADNDSLQGINEVTVKWVFVL